ncbi:galactose mutarotase-like enzyme [Enterococcus sp. PF1-24]|uniref:aldose 1-epimerase family protein n=1 Tax=unclassified Enterococcus TaxID=2608891 RepID=UPI0024763DBD|nr:MULTISPECIES: aldose 1-epimerase family protein [unclassified Enterococcus]MDH6363156.1 galactose mutarotase-like enzyme [Enterococcus sp. PFB1-1]MDH6400250.1 galactose mutarotase-like enzyme [Enterococcus sp. PF1-24]
MQLSIESPQIVAKFNTHGAELTSLVLKESGLEYLWQGDPEFWGRQAPVLFPFVGRLKDDQYRYQGKTYQMGQHGFARDMEFAVLEQKADEISFILQSSPETKKNYPFDFDLIVSYRLGGEGILVTYQVKNTGSEEMHFSVGGHPAFNVPLTEALTFEDYYLNFSPKRTRIRVPLKGPYLDLERRTLGQTNNNIMLTRDLFVEDALVYETKDLNAYTIRSEKSPHSVTLSFNRMNHVGLWSPYPKEAPFVCIEPWCGVADTVEFAGELNEKYAINHLAANEEFTTEYAITLK